MTINIFKNMEQFLNTGWFLANLTTLYIGLGAKLLIMQTKFTGIDEATIKYYALILGVISSFAFLGYNLSKWYQQILMTKKFKRDNNIKKFFKFEEENNNNKTIK